MDKLINELRKIYDYFFEIEQNYLDEMSNRDLRGEDKDLLIDMYVESKNCKETIVKCIVELENVENIREELRKISNTLFNL